MKSILTFLLLAMTAFAADSVIAPAKPQDGTFFTYTGYMTIIIELKDGHSRYWFESDAKSLPESDYPITGTYSVDGDTITLTGSRYKWTFRLVNGRITLWRPDALDAYKTKTDEKFLNEDFFRKYGVGSILIATDKPAEEVWKFREVPTR